MGLYHENEPLAADYLLFRVRQRLVADVPSAVVRRRDSSPASGANIRARQRIRISAERVAPLESSL